MKGKKERGEKEGKEGRKKGKGEKRGDKREREKSSHDLTLYSQLPIATA